MVYTCCHWREYVGHALWPVQQRHSLGTNSHVTFIRGTTIIYTCIAEGKAMPIVLNNAQGNKGCNVFLYIIWSVQIVGITASLHMYVPMVHVDMPMIFWWFSYTYVLCAHAVSCVWIDQNLTIPYLFNPDTLEYNHLHRSALYMYVWKGLMKAMFLHV